MPSSLSGSISPFLTASPSFCAASPSGISPCRWSCTAAPSTVSISLLDSANRPFMPCAATPISSMSVSRPCEAVRSLSIDTPAVAAERRVASSYFLKPWMPIAIAPAAIPTPSVILPASVSCALI